MFCYWFFTKRTLSAKVPGGFVNLKLDGLAASIFLLKGFPTPVSVSAHKYALMSIELYTPFDLYPDIGIFNPEDPPTFIFVPWSVPLVVSI